MNKEHPNRLINLDYRTRYNRNSNTATVTFAIVSDAYEPIMNLSGKSTWVNRTWEGYEYQSALVKALRSAGASPVNIEYVSGTENVHSIEEAFTYLEEHLELSVPYKTDEYLSYK